MKVVKSKKKEPQNINELSSLSVQDKVEGKDIEVYNFEKFKERKRIHKDESIPSFCTYIDKMAFDAFLEYADSSFHENNKGHEACGVILGKYFKDEHGEFIVGTQLERGTGASTSPVLCEISYEDNVRISQISEEKDFLQVIWIHSHPGYGVFYSSQDNQTLKEKYYEKFHVGIVVDNRQLQYKAYKVSNDGNIKEYHNTYLIDMETKDSCKCYKPFSKRTQLDRASGQDSIQKIQSSMKNKKDVIKESYQEKSKVRKKKVRKFKKKDRFLFKAALITVVTLQFLNLVFTIYNIYLNTIVK